MKSRIAVIVKSDTSIGRRYSFRIVLLLTLVVLLVGCAAKKPQPKLELVRSKGEYKVFVTSDGKTVDDFSIELIHRISLTRQEFGQYMKDWPKTLPLPFASRNEKDSRGNPSGVRIVQVNKKAGLHGLGLQRNDLVTAVGTKHTYTSQDMWLLFKLLGEQQRATLTLVRDGKPHKILYSLDDSKHLGS